VGEISGVGEAVGSGVGDTVGAGETLGATVAFGVGFGVATGAGPLERVIETAVPGSTSAPAAGLWLSTRPAATEPL
jgi:hypothetical protein